MKNDMQDIYAVVRDQVTEMKIDFKVKTKLLEKLEDMFVEDADTNAYLRFTTLAKMYESTFVSEKERFLLNKSLCEELGSTPLETDTSFAARMIERLAIFSLA